MTVRSLNNALLKGRWVSIESVYQHTVCGDVALLVAISPALAGRTVLALEMAASGSIDEHLNHHAHEHIANCRTLREAKRIGAAYARAWYKRRVASHIASGIAQACACSSIGTAP
jgi:hypothetical protein